MRHSIWMAPAIAAILFVSIIAPATAADSPRADDEVAIKAASAAFAVAFEKGDAKAIGAFFTEEGGYDAEDAPPIQGRAELEKAYGTFFAKREALKVVGKTDSIKFLGKDTAVEEGTFTVHVKDQPADASRYSALYVRQDGKWLIAMLKEWDEEKTPEAKLDDLAWLIGTWETVGPEMTARTNYEWAEGKKFIKCTFAITNKKDGKKSHTGVQVIGVDPAVGHIRSWTFDADGGIGEANWTFENDHWGIASQATLADGSSTSAINQLTRTGKDTFTWRSVMRTLDGDSLPDVPAVKVTRVSDSK